MAQPQWKPPGTPVPAEEIAHWTAVLEVNEQEAVACERRQTEKVVLIVGTHDGCGGDIEYVSQFHPVAWFRFGGRESMEEQISCHCKQCGVSYNPYFARYRDQVIAHRNR